MSGLWVVCDGNLITFWTRNGPPCSLAGREGRSLVLWEAPVVMVGSDSAEVEQRLGAGELVCPCGAACAGGVTRGAGWGGIPKMTPALIDEAQRMYDARRFTMAESSPPEPSPP